MPKTCSHPNCKKKPIRDSLCSLHLPKIPTRRFLPEDEAKYNKERDDRLNGIFEQEEFRQIEINEEIRRIRSLDCSDFTKSCILDRYFENIRRQKEEEDEKLDRDFSEFLRRINQNFANNRPRMESKKWGKEWQREKSESEEEEKSESKEESPKKSKSSRKFSDMFAILEMEFTTDVKEISRSYKKLAIKLHPDKNPGVDTTAKFQQLSNAYQYIIENI